MAAGSEEVVSIVVNAGARGKTLELFEYGRVEDCIECFLEVETHDAAQLMDAVVIINLLLNAQHRVLSAYVGSKSSHGPVKGVWLFKEPGEASEDHPFHKFADARRECYGSEGV